MKRLLMLLSVVVVLAPMSLWAQDVPKAEIFGGFNAVHIVSDDGDFKQTPLGWRASVAGNVNKTFAVVGEFGGVYKTIEEGGDSFKLKFHSFLGGVKLTHRVEKASVFAQARLGKMRIGFSGDTGGSEEGDNLFQMAYGGGVDVNATNRIAIRVIQFDWMPTKDSPEEGGEWIKNVTSFSFGIVFKLGSK